MNLLLLIVLSLCAAIARTASLDFLFKEDFTAIKKYFNDFSVVQNQTIIVSPWIGNISTGDNGTAERIFQNNENSTILIIAKAKGYDMLLKILLPTISAVACALCLICYVYTVRSCHLFCSGLTRRLFNKNVRLDLHESTRICGFDINRIVISLVNIEFERIFG
jgi:hypothetical protein